MRDPFAMHAADAKQIVQILVTGEIRYRERYEDELKRRAEATEKARLQKIEAERKERERIAKMNRITSMRS